MDKYKQDRDNSPTFDSASASTVPSVKPLSETAKTIRNSTDNEDRSNDQFPSAL